MNIAIIGAGLSGLLAARTLQDAGHTVTIFEKGRGPGGRLSNRRITLPAELGCGPINADNGAQYMTARDEAVRSLVDSWVDHGVLEKWDGSMVSFDGSHWQAVSPSERYVGVPTMSALAKHLAAGLDVRTRQRVQSLVRHNNGWCLDIDGVSGVSGVSMPSALNECYDVVLSCAPPAQSAELFAGHSALARVAQQQAMEPCWSVMLVFAKPVPTSFDGAFVNTSKAIGWCARNNSKPGRDPGVECWTIHTNEAWSRAHVDDSADAVLAAVTAEFLALAGVQHQPVAHSVHRWLYSRPADTTVAEPPYYWDDEQQLGLCGDWCAGGRVEGALLSGLRLAKGVLAFVSRQRIS